jgi:hypothetical protein
MKVTKKQIEAEIHCNTAETCTGCPFNNMDDCSQYRASDTDIARDLLEILEKEDK